MLALQLFLVAKAMVLYNGDYKLIHYPVKHNKILSVYFFFPYAGSIYEKKPGTAELLSRVITKGTKKFPSMKLAEEVEKRAISIFADADYDYFIIGFNTTLENKKEAFNFLREIILNATLPQDEFEKEKEMLLKDIKTKEEDIFEVGLELLNKTVFSDHPYGRPVEGTEESVKDIDRQDILEFLQNNIVRNEAIVSVAGNVNEKFLKNEVEKIMKKLKTNKFKKPEIKLSDKKEATKKTNFEQCYIFITYPAPGAEDSKFPIFKVLNAITGGGMSSKLFLEIREKLGICYVVFSMYPTRPEISLFTVAIATNKENVETAIIQARKTVENLKINEEEVEFAKNRISGSYLLERQKNERIAFLLGYWEIAGKGFSYFDRYIDEIKSVKLQDVLNAVETLKLPYTVKVLSQ